MAVALNNLGSELAEICARFGVEELELFGSATSGDFDPATSDYDFIVSFRPAGSRGHADRYFGLLEALETLTGRHVDLLEANSIRNPYFLKAIRPNRVVLYAA